MMINNDYIKLLGTPHVMWIWPCRVKDSGAQALRFRALQPNLLLAMLGKGAPMLHCQLERLTSHAWRLTPSNLTKQNGARHHEL